MLRLIALLLLVPAATLSAQTIEHEFAALQEAVRQQDLSTALRHSEKLQKLTRGQKDRTRAQLLLNHGDLLLALGQPKQALQPFEESAALLIDLQNDASLNRSLLLEKQAVAYFRQGQPSKAYDALQGADTFLSGWPERDPEDHLRVKMTLHSLAFDLGRERQSRRYGEEARLFLAALPSPRPRLKAELDHYEGLRAFRRDDYLAAAQQFARSHQRLVMAGLSNDEFANLVAMHAAYAYQLLDRQDERRDFLNAIDRSCRCGHLDDGRPKPLKQRPPAYPRKMLRQGIEGLVLVRFDVDRSGQPTSAEAVLELPANGEFGDAALRAVKKFRYEPGRVAGKTVDVEDMYTVISFSIGPG